MRRLLKQKHINKAARIARRIKDDVVIYWDDEPNYAYRYVSLDDYYNDPETEAFVSTTDVAAIIDESGCAI